MSNLRTKGPLREFYLRSTKDGILAGPYTYYEAEGKGRVATREAARTGIGSIEMELVTIVGTRPGDPPITPNARVICMYLAGRKVTGGELAQYNSNKHTYPVPLPETVPELILMENGQAIAFENLTTFVVWEGS